MPAKRFIFATLLLSAGALCGQEIDPGERSFLAEVSALRCGIESGKNLWPGYRIGNPAPAAINFPKSRLTVLFDAGEPIPGFKPASGEILRSGCGSGDRGIYYKPGRLGRVEHHFFNEKVGGREVFVFNLQSDGYSSVYQLNTFAHEYFHDFQQTWRSKKTIPEPFYRDISAEAYAWMLIEDHLLAKALMAEDSELGSLVREFVRVRNYRRNNQPAGLTVWDNQQETSEGTALYLDIQAKRMAGGLSAGWTAERLHEVVGRLLKGSVKLDKGFITLRHYPNGAAQGIIMDRLGISWKQQVMTGKTPFDVLKESLLLSWVPAPGWYLKQKYNYGPWKDYVLGQMEPWAKSDDLAVQDFRQKKGPRLIIKTPFLQKAMTSVPAPIRITGRNAAEMDTYYPAATSFEVKRPGEFDILVKDADLLFGYTGEQLKLGKFTWEGRFAEFAFPQEEIMNLELDGKKLSASNAGEYKFKTLKITSPRIKIDVHSSGRLIQSGDKIILDIIPSVKAK